jgi:hypothetical protein
MTELWEFLTILRAVLFVVTAVFSIWFWATHRFWVPRYVHGMALGATLVGLWMRSILPATAPVRAWGWFGDVTTVLVFPALVYAAFIVFGGPMWAWRTRASKKTWPRDEDEA